MLAADETLGTADTPPDEEPVCFEVSAVCEADSDTGVIVCVFRA